MKKKLLPFNKEELRSYTLEKKIGYGENLAKLKNIIYFIGIDEAGRGPLAGPVVAASVYLNNYKIKELNDSKKLTDKKRRELFPEIIKNMIVGVGVVDEKIIDEINILNATKKAMLLSLEEIQKKIDVELLLIDGNQKIATDIEQITIVKGDSLSYAIAAASIVAKVTRDDIMLKYDKRYPEYGFKNHSGYPTKKHVEAIKRYGVLDIHRKTFRPIKNLIKS